MSNFCMIMYRQLSLYDWVFTCISKRDVKHILYTRTLYSRDSKHTRTQIYTENYELIVSIW